MSCFASNGKLIFSVTGDLDGLNQLKAIFQPVLAAIYKDISKASLMTLDLYVFPALQVFVGNYI